jgi:SAM-dependent methyltransferase
MKRLTDVAYWEENWRGRGRPERLRLYRDVDFETVRLLRRAAGNGRVRVLELGAGGSRVLPYLARNFGFEVFGADFSLSGCRLLRANLAWQRAAPNVVCEDLFQSALPPGAFDLVFSAGLIEHFDDTRGVIAEHLRLVKPGGRVVLIVPNLQGIHGKIVHRLAPQVWSRHRVFGPDELAVLLGGLGVTGIHSGYLGSFLIQVRRDPDWTALKEWPGWLRASVPGAVRLINGLFSFGFRLSPLRPHSRALSPAFFASGVRPVE